MKISDMPEFRDKSHVLTFDQDAKISEAVDAMAKKNYGAVLVTKNDKLCGIFTERDLLTRVGAGRINIEKIPLKDVMSTKLKTAKINDDVSSSLRRMSQGRFRHMPVVDEKGDLQGLLSQGDFVAFTMSDAIHRAGESAKAGITEGYGTPFSILAAIFVYTIALLVVISALGHYMG